MHKSNNYEYHTPPHLPPFSVSFPSQTRPEPDSKSTLKPALTVHSDDNLKAVPQSDHRDLKKTRLEPEPQPKSALAIKDLKKPRPEPTTKNDTALVAVVENYYSPLTSPLPVTADNFPAAPPPSHQILQFSRREEVPPTNSAVVHGGGGGVMFGGGKDVVRRSKKEGVLKRVGLGVRVLETVFCLISFSVMAADQTQGWSGVSLYRYKEYRFTVAVTVFGFVYAAFQAYDLGSYIATGKHVITHRFRCQFDIFMDQIIAYLLISASSAAASRVDDWQANWGKDEFTAKASASISMAFLAFICFALSSLISGYNLCNHDLY